MFRRFFFAAIAVGTTSVMTACDAPVAPKQSSIADDVTPPATEQAAPAETFLFQTTPGEIGKHLGARRGAVITTREQSGTVDISADPQNDSGAYVVLRLPEDIATQLVGKRIAIELTASSADSAVVQVVYNTLPSGRSLTSSIQLDSALSTHLSLLEFPSDADTSEGAMVFIQAPSPGTVYTLAGIRVGYAN